MEVLKKIIKEHIKYKQQIARLAEADLAKTYRGAALGWLWALIKPTVTILVYWFTFTVGLRVGKPVNGFPYFLWLIAGIIPWIYMSEIISGGIDCIRKYSFLITKMKFPIATIPTFVNISKFLIHLILIAIMILIFTIFGYPIDVYLLQLPVYVLLTFIFFNVWTLFSSLVAAVSKDYSNLIKSFVNPLFWLSGIMWNVDNINNNLIRTIFNLNPITYLVNGYRNCTIYKVWFWEEPMQLLGLFLIFVILMMLSLRVYQKLRKDIPDIL